jgi:hypothetical protein
MNARPQAPPRLVFARVIMALGAVILLAIPLVNVIGFATMAADGTHLAFSQEEMHRIGPQPAPMVGEPAPDPFDGPMSVQYVDLPSIVAPMALGIVAAVGAVAAWRRRRWALVAGIAAVSVVTLAALLPILEIIWATGYYSQPISAVLPMLIVATLPLVLALVAFWGVLTSRSWFRGTF